MVTSFNFYNQNIRPNFSYRIERACHKRHRKGNAPVGRSQVESRRREG